MKTPSLSLLAAWIGDAIPESIYKTIAEIIAFAWYLKGKAPKGFYHREAMKQPLQIGNSPDHTD